MRRTPESNLDGKRIRDDGLPHYPESALLRLQTGLFYSALAQTGWSANPDDDIRIAIELAQDAFKQGNLSLLELRLGHWLLAEMLMMEGDFDDDKREAAIAIVLGPMMPSGSVTSPWRGSGRAVPQQRCSAPTSPPAATRPTLGITP